MTNIKSVILARFHAPITNLALSLCAALGIASAAKADFVMKTGTTTANWGDEGLWVGDSGNYVIDYNSPNADITFTAAESIASGFWLENANNGLVKFEATDPAYGLTMTGGDMHVGGVNWGFLEIDSGTYEFQNDLYIAYSKAHWYDGDKGSLTIKGGELTVGNRIVVANYGGEDGTEGALYLSGGTLCAKTIVEGEGSGTVEFYGGTLRAIDDGILIGSGLTVNVPDGYSGTIYTDGFDITIASAVGGTGTLNITGGGKVTFTVEPTCTIDKDNETTVVYDVPDDGSFRWTGASTENSNWSNPDNWNGGVVPSSVDDSVVIPDGANITLAEDATAGTITVNGAVNINGNGKSLFFLTVDKGVSTAEVTAENLYLRHTSDTAGEALFTPDLRVLADKTVYLLNEAAKENKVFVRQRYVKLTGNLKGAGTVEAYSNVGSNANTGNGFTLASADNSGFSGTINMYSNAGQQRDSHKIYASATTPTVAWRVYVDSSSSNYAGGLFVDAGTVETRQKYYFGSLALKLPANYGKSQALGVSNIEFEIGNLDVDSYLYGADYFNSNSGIRWVAETATLSNAVSNAAYIDVVGGGNLALAASGIPTAINFSGNGGYIVLTDDVALNASILAAVSTIAEGATFGFVYDGEREISLDLSGKVALLAGKAIAKKGMGTVCLAGLSGSDIVVSEGALVLPHGAVVGDVTVAQGASLLVDLIGAEDNEVVFKYDSISGEATYRNKATIGEVEVDDTENTWTYKVTGAARTFTWNGEDGASWNDAANWLIDGEATTDIPSAIDTVQFNESATISASGTLVGDVQIADGVTLTIPAGLTFSKLTAASGAAIAFNSDPIATVRGTLTLITVGVASGVDAALDLPPNYGVSVDAGTGAITATRNAATYTWTGAADNNWATSGNWKVGDSAVAEVPVDADTVVFASDASVTLTGDAVAKAVVVNANVVITGGSYKITTPSVYTENAAAGLLTANGLKIMAPADADLALSVALNIPADKVFETETSTQYRHVHLWAKVTGKGEWRLNQSKTQERGALYCHGDASGDNSGADMSEFAGTVNVYNYSTLANRDNTRFWGALSTSSNAVWNLVGYNKVHDNGAMLRNNNTTYYFGALSGSVYASGKQESYNRNTWEIGAREDVDSVLTGNLFVNNYPGLIPTRSDTIRKVGGSKLTFSGSCVRDYEINGGTLEMTSPSTLITYYVEGDKGTGTITSNPEEATASVRSTISFKLPGGTLRLTDQNLVDPSSVIANSTAPIAVDDGDVDRTWATALADSNDGGLIKDGSGTLTLSAAPEYTGVTWVKAGKLVVPAEVPAVELTLDPRTAAGAVENAHVAGWAYIANTVVYANDTDDDNMTVDIDASGIAKIDISDPSFVDVLRNQKRVVICGTTGTISGFSPKKFVLGETLLVPERPDGVPEQKWQWAAKVMQVNGKNCICVTTSTQPLFIRLR